MNYLAHLLLASHSDAAMLGAFLGDFVKGRDYQAFDPEIRRDILVHRRVDSFTDNHPVVREAREKFAPSRRRFAGIALDVLFDHVLAREWQQHGEGALDQFTRRVYRMFEHHAALMPASARDVASRMAQQDWLGAYAQREGLERALAGIGRRLSRHGERLAACAQDLRKYDAELVAGFHRLFPELRRQVVDFRLEADLADD